MDYAIKGPQQEGILFCLDSSFSQRWLNACGKSESTWQYLTRGRGKRDDEADADAGGFGEAGQDHASRAVSGGHGRDYSLAELAAAVRTACPKVSENGGRPSIPLERMLRIYSCSCS